MKKASRQTYLDVFSGILSEVTGRPEARFRQVITQAIESGVMPAANWFKPAPKGLYQQLQQEKSGILNWLLEGMAQRRV